MLVNLSNEQQLLIEMSKLSQFKELDLDLKKINWFEFFKLALYHKTFTLCWKNISKIYQFNEFPKYLYSILNYSYISIKEQNKLFLKELDTVVKELKNNNIIVIPVKGGMLISLLYEDEGMRFLGDLDCLVKFDQIENLKNVMKKLGYVQGDLDENSNVIKPISRSQEIKWKLGMSNLYPFRKLTGNNKYPVIKFDFRYSLSDDQDKRCVNEIIEDYNKNNTFQSFYVLLHLCTHFYDEAKHAATIYVSKDLNLVKLCDIREYILQCMSEIEIYKTVEVAEKYMLSKQIYFTLYCLKSIYNDGYEDKLLNSITLDNFDFLDTFGENTKDEKFRFTKEFQRRLFCCDNSDEIISKPKYLIKLFDNGDE